LIELDIGMVEPAILTEETGGSEIERCQVENQMASDLSGLSARSASAVTPSQTVQLILVGSPLRVLQ